MTTVAPTLRNPSFFDTVKDAVIDAEQIISTVLKNRETKTADPVEKTTTGTKDVFATSGSKTATKTVTKTKSTDAGTTTTATTTSKPAPKSTSKPTTSTTSPASTSTPKSSPAPTPPPGTSNNSVDNPDAAQAKGMEALDRLGDGELLLQNIADGNVPAELRNSPTAMLALQQRLNNFQTMITMVSTMMRSMHDMQMELIRNLKV